MTNTAWTQARETEYCTQNTTSTKTDYLLLLPVRSDYYQHCLCPADDPAVVIETAAPAVLKVSLQALMEYSARSGT